MACVERHGISQYFYFRAFHLGRRFLQQARHVFWCHHKSLDTVTTTLLLLKTPVVIEAVVRSRGDGASKHKPFSFASLDFVGLKPYHLDFLGLELTSGTGTASEHARLLPFRHRAREPTRDVRPLDWAEIWLVSSIYISLHFIGWDFDFSTTVEQNFAAP